MKKYKFFTTAIIAVLYLSIVSLNAQNFRADYRLNLQPITEVAITDDGGTGFLAVVSGINTLNREIIMLVKLNYKFDVEWTKSLDYTLYAGDICAYDVKRDPNGGYAI